MKRVFWDAVVGIVLASLLGWGVWTTTKIFELSQCDAVAQNDTKAVSKSVEELKTAVKAIDQKIEDGNKIINQKIEDQNKTREDNQKETYRILLDIQKQIKTNGSKDGSK